METGRERLKPPVRYWTPSWSLARWTSTGGSSAFASGGRRARTPARRKRRTAESPKALRRPLRPGSGPPWVSTSEGQLHHEAAFHHVLSHDLPLARLDVADLAGLLHRQVGTQGRLLEDQGVGEDRQVRDQDHAALPVVADRGGDFLQVAVRAG